MASQTQEQLRPVSLDSFALMRWTCFFRPVSNSCEEILVPKKGEICDSSKKICTFIIHVQNKRHPLLVQNIIIRDAF